MTLKGPSKRSMLIGSVCLYAGTATLAYYLSGRRSSPANEAVDGDEERISTSGFLSAEEKRTLYSRLAGQYDRLIGRDEIFLLLTRLRKTLMRRAHGDVLEIAGGTGRNLSYYANDCHVTVTDGSASMLKVAKEKAHQLLMDRDDQSDGVKFTFEVQDAEHLPYPDDRFDTVVDTFGLCSVDDPKAVLSEAQRVCKPDGTVLLLEHGASSYRWLRTYQAKSSHKHYQKWGCMYDRDINSIVEESGLRIVSSKLWHLGTTHVIIAKPNKSVNHLQPEL